MQPVDTQASMHEKEQFLPGIIMATQTEVFSKLEHLCTLGSPEVTKAVRGLQMLIPTDHRVSEMMDVFTHAPLEGAGATEDHATPTTPQAALSNYLSPANTSPTQLLYNLEVKQAAMSISIMWYNVQTVFTNTCRQYLVSLLVPFTVLAIHGSIGCTQVLSSRLIPAAHKTEDTITQIFRRTFLESGGLKSVINVLQKNALPSDLDLVIRQDCYAIALSLARYIALQSVVYLHLHMDVLTSYMYCNILT